MNVDRKEIKGLSQEALRGNKEGASSLGGKPRVDCPGIQVKEIIPEGSNQLCQILMIGR